MRVLIELNESELLGLLFCLNYTIAKNTQNKATEKPYTRYRSKDALQRLNNELSNRLRAVNMFVVSNN